MTKEHTAALDLIRQAIGQASGSLAITGGASGETADAELHWADGRPPAPMELISWPANQPYPFTPPLQKDAVWVLRRAPRHLLEELRNEGRSFVDVGRGVVRLTFPGLLIDRTDLIPLPRAPDAERMRDPFADRASLVARTLFRHPDRSWGTRELAEAAGVSPMVVSYAVRRLAEWEALDLDRTGRTARIRLRSERRLVEVWTTHYDWRKNPHVAFAAPVGSPYRFLQRVGSAIGKHRWALTMQAGASLLAPHATWDKVHVYVDVPSIPELHSIGASARWPADPKGQVVLLRPWYRDSLWTEIQLRHGLPVAGTLQLILDLWHYPVRGREQAEHLLDVHLADRKRRVRAKS